MSQVDGSVCIDCLMVIANGDTSGIDDLEGWEKAVEAVDALEGGRFMAVLVGEDTFFGVGRCAFCGSTLAGDRHDVAFIDMSREGSQ